MIITVMVMRNAKIRKEASHVHVRKGTTEMDNTAKLESVLTPVVQKTNSVSVRLQSSVSANQALQETPLTFALTLMSALSLMTVTKKQTAGIRSEAISAVVRAVMSVMGRFVPMTDLLK